MDTGDEEISRVQLQIFAPGSSGDSALPFWTATIAVGNWQTVDFSVPSSTARQVLQIRPVNRPAVIEVGEISISCDDGRTLWKANTLPDLQALQTAGSISLLPGKGRCLYFSFKADPLWLLPAVDISGASSRLKIVLCIHKNFEAVFGAIETAYAEFYEMAAQIRSASAHRNQVLRGYKRRAEALAEDLDNALQNAEERGKTAEAMSKRVAQLEEQITEQRNALVSELDTLRAEHQGVLQRLSGMESSLSWRITSPLRSALAFVRRL